MQKRNHYYDSFMQQPIQSCIVTLFRQITRIQTGLYLFFLAIGLGHSPTALAQAAPLRFEAYLALIGELRGQAINAQSQQQDSCHEQLSSLAAQLNDITQILMPDGSVVAVDHVQAGLPTTFPSCSAAYLVKFLDGICPTAVCPSSGILPSDQSLTQPETAPQSQLEEFLAEETISENIPPSLLEGNPPQPESTVQQPEAGEATAVDQALGGEAPAEGGNGSEQASQAGAASDELAESGAAADSTGEAGTPGAETAAEAGAGLPEEGSPSEATAAAVGTAGAEGTAVGEQPAADDTESAETAVAETAVAEIAVAETAVAETAVAETAVAETAVAETAVAETAVAETAVAETAVAETAVVDEQATPDSDLLANQNQPDQRRLAAVLIAVILLILLLGAFLFWTFRRRKLEALPLKPQTVNKVEKEVQSGRHHLTQKEYRQAIRKLFKATLYILEDRGQLRFEQTRTNYELLTAVSTTPKLLTHLSPVVAAYERVWYGFEPLASHEFDSLVAQIEQLKSV